MKVKKHAVENFLRISIFLGTFLAMGCSDENREDIQPASEVVFDSMLPEGWSPMSSSRSVTVGSTELQTLGFGVFAYYTADKSWEEANATIPNFMNNTHVTSTDGTTWTYSPIKYWPNNQGDKLSFFAYAPYIGSSAVTGSELGYTVSADVDSQVDLLWSNSDTKEKTKADETVHFTFRHALSRIGFSAEAKIEGESPIDQYEKVKMQVKKIVLTSVDDYAGTGTGPFYRQGVLELNNQTDEALWNDCSGTQGYMLEESHLASHDLTLTQHETSRTSQNLTTEENYLMILPQDFSAAGFHVYVEYDVHLWFYGNGVETGKEHEYFTYTNGCVGNLKINFEPGMAYIINLQLGLEDATLGEVTMTEWGEVGEVKLEDLLEEKE